MTKKTNVILSVFHDDYEICIAPRCRVKMDKRGLMYIIVNNRKLPIHSAKFPRPINIDHNGKYTVDVKEGLDELTELLRVQAENKSKSVNNH